MNVHRSRPFQTRAPVNECTQFSFVLYIILMQTPDKPYTQALLTSLPCKHALCARTGPVLAASAQFQHVYSVMLAFVGATMPGSYQLSRRFIFTIMLKVVDDNEYTNSRSGLSWIPDLCWTEISCKLADRVRQISTQLFFFAVDPLRSDLSSNYCTSTYIQQNRNKLIYIFMYMY